MYKAPLEQYKQLLAMYVKDHEEYDQATMEQVVTLMAKFCEEGLWPTNAQGDNEGLSYNTEDKSVLVPKVFHEVYKTICENGYASLALSTQYGGGGAPWVLHHIASEMLASGNLSLSTCPMLTNGAVETLIKNASDDIKSRYLEKMVRGEYSGTMCLTESQCGTDLGLIKTQAKPNDDHYLITGTKIWITFGEHDLSENIIHLVLAKTPDAPEGTKGISLFLVPKFLEDGSRNQVSCGGLEHKMGQRASPTAVMNFDGAIGYLVGEEHSGMRAMFQMMNPARIGVGVQGLGQSEAAFQQALNYAKQRRQSRAVDPKDRDNDAQADIILVHPDIRRMLMTIESTNYAMRHLIAYCSQQLDQSNDEVVGILTPIIKSYITEQSMENVSMAMQIMGGMGYVKDGLCEQLYRDGRITMIYEGTNGIQALDLIGRKIAKDGGVSLIKLLNTFDLDDYREAIDKANGFLLEHAGDPTTIAAIAPSYLNLLAITIQIGLVLKDNNMDKDLCAFYLDYIGPMQSLYLSRILKGKSHMMSYRIR